ncbi:MAG: hypothetical protein RIN55_01125 [Tissierellaceae bacterium]|nr:hypothetical protein [Tissierellaceae bacterium]
MSKKSKLYVLFLLMSVSVFLLTACMPGDGSYSPQDPANFLSGIWHGWIAPISLILSIGNSSRGIYESMNTGFWYDFGFYMAIISGFGGLSLSRNKKKK